MEQIETKPQHGDLKVWWIPQVPGKAFEVRIGNTKQVAGLLSARLLLGTLARYDAFQFENRIRPDYSNAGGLQVYDAVSDEWIDWHDSEGREFDEIPAEELPAVVWEEFA